MSLAKAALRLRSWLLPDAIAVSPSTHHLLTRSVHNFKELSLQLIQKFTEPVFNFLVEFGKAFLDNILAISRVLIDSHK